MRLVGEIDGRDVRQYSTGEWFYDDDEVAPDTPGAQEYDGHFFLDGWGVAVEWEGAQSHAA